MRALALIETMNIIAPPTWGETPRREKAYTSGKRAGTNVKGVQINGEGVSTCIKGPTQMDKNNIYRNKSWMVG